MRKLSAQDRLGMLLLLGCGLFLTIAAVAAGVLRARESQRDSSTNCDVARPSSGVTVVLLDCTDPLTSDQVEAVTNRLRRLEGSETAPNVRVSLWVLGATDAGQLRRVFCRCHPGRRANPVFQNPRLIAAACESLFTAPLVRALRTAPLRGRAARSPILEGIRTLELSELRATATPRRLVLISDLRQNSPALSLYTRSPDFATFRSNPRLARLLPDLTGVDVEVLRVPRGGEDLEAELPLLDFWQAYFEAAGARTIQIARLT